MAAVMAPSTHDLDIDAVETLVLGDADETIEERCFSAALICLEGHYTDSPPMGPLTSAKVTSMISRTLEKTHTFKEVRETLSRNVALWIWLTRIFAAAIPNLTTRSVGPLASLNDPERGVTALESTNLILRNYPILKDDLQILNKLMHIARNLLVTAEPEVAQDLCAAVHFDQMVYQTIILCVNVTSKGYDGEIVDDTSRAKLNEITEMYKKILITSLQQAHNWTAKNDRNKMSFWFDVLFDDDNSVDILEQQLPFRPDIAKTEVQHWLERNSKMCDKAQVLLKAYAQSHFETAPGPLAPISPLAGNWLPEGTANVRADDPKDDTRITPQWKENESDKFEQDRAYARVSREIDTWWLRSRDPNYENWVVPMPSIDFAHARTENCKNNLMHRYNHSYRAEDHGEPFDGAHDQDAHSDVSDGRIHDDLDDRSLEEDDLDDDDSYGEGPMAGLLTEIPNILAPKQIEALHMIVKSCILDTAGAEMTRAGENLQKTRCRMFLALDFGKSLLREMLVFIAVWEMDEQSLIFQITTQIVEAIHNSALIPYAWTSLRIPKDIISPAQTMLLKLINHMFKARNNKPPAPESKEHLRDVKLVHFLFTNFRSRIVPECVALMHLQAQIRGDVCDPADFPVDNWDMERAKDGLAQFLDFLATVTEVIDLRKYLIEWEAAYDLIALLNGLEAGVPKKPLVELPDRSANRPHASSPPTPRDQEHWDAASDDPYNPQHPPPPPPPPMAELAHKFPWPGIKGPILTILAGLLQPPAGQTSPGNADVQMQIVRHNGIVPLLNCCVYDDHNRYARERVQVCLKWLMDGSEAANNFLRDLVTGTPPPPNMRHARPPTEAAGAAPAEPLTTSLRIDGIGGEVKVQVRNPNPPGTASSSSATSAAPATASAPVPAPVPAPAPATDTTTTTPGNPEMAVGLSAPATARLVNLATKALMPLQNAPVRPAAQAEMRFRSEELLRDIISLADEAARLALGQRTSEDTARHERDQRAAQEREEDFI